MRQVNGQASTPVPARFLVSIGGFGGPHYEVRWRSGRLRYRSNDSQMTVAPSAEAWETFWTALDRIGVWGWRPQYDDLETMDGTQWSVEISDGVRSVRCFGSNQYPGGRDLAHAKPFMQFLKAVETLVGRPFGSETRGD